MRTFLKIFFPVFIYFSVTAQTTTVSGRIYDWETKEPLPFVNIILKGTKAGTTSDFDGNYTISTNEKTDSIIVSYIGYDRLTRSVKANVAQTIILELHKNSVNLTEVVIKAGENPAWKIFRKIIANKERNDRENADAYQYEVYNKIEFDLNNISEDAKKRKILKPIKFVFDNIDSSDVKLKPFLPLFITESVSDYYYKRKPKFKKEIIRGSKVSGLEDASVSQFMGEMYQKVDIYNNTILVFDKNFISPISDNGLLYYKYYLIDSIVLDNTRCYQIQFKPRRKQELTFTGNMWIADTTFAVKRLEMSIANDANINYVKMFNVVQDYIKADSTMMLSKDKLVVDFKMLNVKNASGFYGRKTTSYKNFIINKPKEDSFYSKTDDLIVQENAYKRPDTFWQTSRHDTLSRTEKQIYKMVDTIQSLPIYKTWVDVITIFVTGYKVKGNLEIGPYSNILSFNRVEGTRVRFGGRTSNSFSNWYELSAYAAYGFRDEKFKCNLNFKSFISKNPRRMVGMSYKNDVELLGQSQNAFTQDNILVSFFRRRPLNSLTRVQQVKAWYEYEWFKGLNTQFFFTTRQMTPLGALVYQYTKNNGELAVQDNIITSEIRVLTRFAFGEKYVESAFTRASLGTKYPIFQFDYTHGIKNLFNSHYLYNKFTINIDDRFRINPIGFTDYLIQAGKIFGQVPYPLMELHGGNETYIYDYYAYNMMNYYEFASDQYLSLAVFHHFDGFFLNKIPLLRKLKWREVVSGKVLMGSITQKNRELLILPTTLNALNKGAYYEAGVGIENIFKVFRVDAFWRLSYLNNPNISKFGIKANLQVAF